VLLGQVLGFGGIVPVATTIGVLAGLVQILGLLRWVYVVPALARAHADQTLAPEQREAHAAVFRALHPYLGIGVGLAAGSAESLGPTEERGWGLAGAAIPLLYIAWSKWLLAMGIALIA
jgi:hypothetical protein